MSRPYNCEATFNILEQFCSWKAKSNCYYCGCDITTTRKNKKLVDTERTIEHLIPVSLGGDKKSYNKYYVCYVCNNEHGRLLDMLKNVNDTFYKPTKRHRNDYRASIKQQIKSLNERMGLVGYNPLVIYLSFLKDAHPDLIKYIGDLTSNDQSYTNVCL